MPGPETDTSVTEQGQFLADGLRRVVGGRFGDAVAASFAAEGVDELKLTKTLSGAFQFAETTLAGLLSQSPPQQAIACKAGCSHCCKRASVDTTAPEVLLLAAWLRENRTEDELNQIKADVEEIATATKGLSPAERYWVKKPCPFLKDDCCSVYPARPLICRGANSTNVDACVTVFNGEPTAARIPQYGPQVALYYGLYDGLVRALSGAGRPAESLCLFPAMNIALSMPDAAARYCAGENIFQSATVAHHRKQEGTP